MGVAIAMIVVVVIVIVAIAVMVEGEQVHEITDRRAIFGLVAVVVAVMDWVRKIVPAAIRDLWKIPVLFDELQQRDVVMVGVIDMALLGEGRNRDKRNPGAVAQEVDRLDISGIVVAAAFVGGNEDRGRLPEVGIAFNPIDQRLQEFFVVVGRRIRWMSGQGLER